MRSSLLAGGVRLRPAYARRSRSGHVPINQPDVRFGLRGSEMLCCREMVRRAENSGWHRIACNLL
jgi:hypothetical protein